MENKGHVEWTKTLSENDCLEIKRNIILGEIFLIGTGNPNALECFEKIFRILDSIGARPNYKKESEG